MGLTLVEYTPPHCLLHMRLTLIRHKTHLPLPLKQRGGQEEEQDEPS